MQAFMRMNEAEIREAIRRYAVEFYNGTSGGGLVESFDVEIIKRYNYIHADCRPIFPKKVKSKNNDPNSEDADTTCGDDDDEWEDYV